MVECFSNNLIKIKVSVKVIDQILYRHLYHYIFWPTFHGLIGQFYRKNWNFTKTCRIRWVYGICCSDAKFLEGLILAPPTSTASAPHGVSFLWWGLILDVRFYSISTSNRRAQTHVCCVWETCWAWRVQDKLWGYTDGCLWRILRVHRFERLFLDSETLSCLPCLWDQTEPTGPAAVVPVQVNEPQACSWDWSCCSNGANKLWIPSSTLVSH